MFYDCPALLDTKPIRFVDILNDFCPVEGTSSTGDDIMYFAESTYFANML